MLSAALKRRFLCLVDEGISIPHSNTLSHLTYDMRHCWSQGPAGECSIITHARGTQYSALTLPAATACNVPSFQGHSKPSQTKLCQAMPSRTRPAAAVNPSREALTRKKNYGKWNTYFYAFEHEVPTLCYITWSVLIVFIMILFRIEIGAYLKRLKWGHTLLSFQNYKQRFRKPGISFASYVTKWVKIFFKMKFG